MTTESTELCLLLEAGSRLCALPLSRVQETMRPQPVRPVAGAPSFVLGAAVIRGVPVPVVDCGSALGERPSDPTRFVTLKVGQRAVALAVDRVLGVKRIESRHISGLPPLLAAADGAAVAAIGTLDAELLTVLDGARLVPDSVWTTIEAGADE